MFQYIAEDIAFLLIKNKTVDIEKRDECVYGAEVLLVNLSNILTALIISILTKSMLHFAAFMLIFVPLRIFTGGYHAKTSESCYLITSSMYALTVLCVKLMPELYSNIPAIITLAVLIVPILANGYRSSSHTIYCGSFDIWNTGTSNWSHSNYKKGYSYDAVVEFGMNGGYSNIGSYVSYASASGYFS